MSVHLGLALQKGQSDKEALELSTGFRREGSAILGLAPCPHVLAHLAAWLLFAGRVQRELVPAGPVSPIQHKCLSSCKAAEPKEAAHVSYNQGHAVTLSGALGPRNTLWENGGPGTDWLCPVREQGGYNAKGQRFL